jgi:hypothetical protein
MAGVDVIFKLCLSIERFATLCTSPKVDPVVKLCQLGFALNISPGVQGALVGQAESRLELSHYGHPGLK